MKIQGNIFITLVVALLTLTSCHTTEENYKASYDKAVEKAREGVGADTYAKIVAEQTRNTDVVNGDSVRIVARFVGCIDVSPEQTRRYNVVLRDFKQVVNARSMRDRLIAEGHGSYVLYYAKDKLYYVVIDAYDTREEAAELIRDAKKRVKMNVPLDKLWILEKQN
ncbi:MAG: SPOR domain-containing protein [Muribaculaceae bacterium]